MSWKTVMKQYGDNDVTHKNRAADPYRLKNARKSTVQHHTEKCLSDKPKSVLDLGCGDAPWLDAAGEAAGSIQYTGIDYSSTQVESAKSVYPGENFRFVSDDIETCDFGDKLFDVVASHLVLHLLDDPKKVVGKAFAAMREGASFHVAVPAYWLKNSTDESSRLTRISSVFSRFADAAIPPANYIQTGFGSEEGIRGILAECGFSPDSIAFEYDHLDLSGTPSDILTFMTNLYSFAVLKDDVKPTAAAAFLEAALAERDERGNVICHRPMAFITATKTH